VIVPEYKLFFHHIPKTGGGTVEDFLFDHYKLPQKSWLYFNEGFKPRTSFSDKSITTLFSLCHFPYLELIELAQNSKIHIDDSWNIFTIVRNPYFRVISAIFYQPILECVFHMHTLYTIAEKRKLFKKAFTTYFDVDHYMNDWFGHRVPQHLLLETNPDKPLYKMFKYEEGLENILNKVLGDEIKEPIKLRQVHSLESSYFAPKTDYFSLFTREYIERVNKYYYEDFQFCGYEMWDPLDFPEN
jgi:hypothetical protein